MADQILVTFGLAIVLQEIIKAAFGANPIPQPAPEIVSGSANIGAWLGLGDAVVYPWWRLIYFAFSVLVIAAVFAFLHFTTFGMVVRAGMRDRETVGLLGINIQRRFTIVFGIAVVVAGLAGAMYTPILRPTTTWAWSSWCCPSWSWWSAAWAHWWVRWLPASCSASCSRSRR